MRDELFTDSRHLVDESQPTVRYIEAGRQQNPLARGEPFVQNGRLSGVELALLLLARL